MEQLDLNNLSTDNRRELSKWFSAIDRGDINDTKTLNYLWEHKKEIPVVGFSGPPGAGKSSLLGAVIQKIPEDKKILLLCIDPSSPLTGGALLGDRLRIVDNHKRQNVFVRSLSNHGFQSEISSSLDGLILVGQNAGFDVIFVEGVGSGQAEFSLRDYVDLFCLLLVPESGDRVQMMKAGSLEIADIVILNKSDRPASAQLWSQIQEQLDEKVILQTNALDGTGVQELIDTIHRELENKKVTYKDMRASRTFIKHFLSHLEEALERKLDQSNTPKPFTVSGAKYDELVQLILKNIK